MILSAEEIKQSGKATKFRYIHPHTGRMCISWFPNSKVKQMGDMLIEIPRWFWDKQEFN